MNWLDNAIAYISPTRGFKRARARMALDVMRAYEGAKLGRRTDGWITKGTSANAEIQPALTFVRNRSRDLVRNNPYANKAINTLVARSIGTGIQAKSSIGKLWKQWIKECDVDGDLDFYGLSALAARTIFESGEVLVRFRTKKLSDGLAIPLQIQILEPDFLDHTKNQVLADGHYVVAGIEFNVIGQRVAYWLFDQHPGDSIYMGEQAFQSKRVDASLIIHVFEKMRPGQVRGISRLAVSIMKIKDYDDYDEAELVRKKIEACFAVFVSGTQEDNPIGPTTNDPSAPGMNKRIEHVEPGMINYLRPDEVVNFGAPNATGGYGEYSKVQLQAMATGTGVTYAQLTGDLSAANYSSTRAGTIEFRSLVEMFQWLTFIPMFCNKIAAKAAEVAYMAGLSRQIKVDFDWTTPKWPWVDPLKDIQAEVLAINNALKSRSESIRENGYEPDTVYKELAQDQKTIQKYGIKLVEGQSSKTESNNDNKADDKAEKIDEDKADKTLEDETSTDDK